MFSYKKKYEVANAKLELLAHKRIFNVDSFNEWFCDDSKSKDIYAHAGIFGRTDKLSQHHFVDYFHSLTDELTRDEVNDIYEEFFFLTLKFKDEVVHDWLHNIL